MIAAMVALACIVNDAQLKTHPTPEQAAAWVVADLASLPVEDRPHQFYVWLPHWADAMWHHAAASAMNHAVSRSRVIQRPVVIADGWMQRWDMRLIWPDEKDYQRLLPVLDECRVKDPFFYDQSSGDLHFAIRRGLIGVDFIAPNYPLRVMRADQFIRLTLSSIEGGMYLELMDLTTFSDNGRTQEEQVLARNAIFLSTSESIDGDRRVGMFSSGVTNKARAVQVVSGNALNRAWLTQDIFDEDTEANTHAIYNLLKNEFRGKEIIWELPNGLHGFLITDQNGTVLREAPPQLVTDHMVPRPHTARLQGGAVSCLRCHASESGLRSCSNDVARLLSGPLQVLGDTARGFDQETIDSIAARYSGRDFDRELRRGREDYEAAIDELTGGEMTATELNDLTADIYGEAVYPDFDATRALRDLGIELREPFTTPVSVLRELVAARPAGLPVVVEDPTIAALCEDIEVRPSDYHRVYGTLLNRAAAWRLAR